MDQARDAGARLYIRRLTQGRAHPAVVNSTPAGERQRPAFVEVTLRRLEVEASQQPVSNHETASQTPEQITRQGFGKVGLSSLS